MCLRRFHDNWCIPTFGRRHFCRPVVVIPPSVEFSYPVFKPESTTLRGRRRHHHSASTRPRPILCFPSLVEVVRSCMITTEKDRLTLERFLARTRRVRYMYLRPANVSPDIGKRATLAEDSVSFITSNLVHVLRDSPRHRQCQVWSHAKSQKFQLPTKATVTARSSLSVHIRTHTGDKPYTCLFLQGFAILAISTTVQEGRYWWNHVWTKCNQMRTYRTVF